MKTCTKCGVEKPLENFYKDVRLKGGRRHQCDRCILDRHKKLRHRYAEYRKRYHLEYRAKNKAHLDAREAQRKLDKRGAILVTLAKKRAKKSNVAFDLDAHIPQIEAIIKSGKCQMTGLPFDLTPGRTFASPSIDRIRPSEGYVFGNVRVILFGMNTALGDWGEETLRSFVSAWLART